MIKSFAGSRSKKGASIALVIVCVFLCVLLICFCFNFGMIMGGSQQVRNAVDAAVLNVAKRVVESKVQANSAFEDCADTTGQVGISNIARVWGKAMLINANAQEMVGERTAGVQTVPFAETSYNMANELNSDLAGAVRSKSRLNSYYSHMSGSRQAGLLGFGGSPSLSRSSDEPFDFAMVGRGGESNMTYEPDQFPPGASVAPSGCSKCLPGYSPFQVNGRTFMLATFPAGKMPSLLADKAFQSQRAESLPLGDGPAAIPNAFSSSGYVDGNRASIRASAAALANPQRQYSLAIPQAFVLLEFTNTSYWYVKHGEKKEELVTVKTYEKAPKEYHEIKAMKLPEGGKLDVWAALGNEYQNPSLLAVLNANPGNYNVALKKMAQRLKEIDKDFTLDELTGLLTKTEITENANFLIYPNYNTPDFTDPQITIADSQSKSLPEWLAKTAGPDGIGKELLKTAEMENEPNTCVAERTEYPRPFVKAYTKVHGTINWAPGTGFKQCLGRMISHSETKIVAEIPPEQ